MSEIPSLTRSQRLNIKNEYINTTLTLLALGGGGGGVDSAPQREVFCDNF